MDKGIRNMIRLLSASTASEKGWLHELLLVEGAT